MDTVRPLESGHSVEGAHQLGVVTFHDESAGHDDRPEDGFLVERYCLTEVEGMFLRVGIVRILEVGLLECRWGFVLGILQLGDDRVLLHCNGVEGDEIGWEEGALGCEW